MKESEFYYMAIGQNLAPKERIYRNIVKKKTRAGLPGRRIAMIAAACLVLAVTSVLCIPEARAAILSWLTPAVDPRTYLDTPEEERTAAPALAAAIEPMEGRAFTAEVVDAADEAWQIWAEALQVRFDEMLYDGQTLYLTGALSGNIPDLVKSVEKEYIKETDETGTSFSPPGDMVVSAARYRVGGTEFHSYHTTVLRTHTDSNVDNAEYYIAQGEIPMQMQLPVGAGLTGLQQLTLELLFTDMDALRVENEKGFSTFPTKVALRIDGLTFDATAGTKAQEALRVPEPVALTGDVRVLSVKEDAASGTTAVGNDVLSLTGGQFDILKMQQKLTGTEIVFHVTLPEGWTQAQCFSLSDRISVEFCIDGENQGGFGKTYMSIRYYDNPDRLTDMGIAGAPDVTDWHNIVFSVETGLMTEDWARISSLEAMLTVYELTSYNDAPLPDDDRVTVPTEAGGWSEDGEMKRFDGCKVKIK